MINRYFRNTFFYEGGEYNAAIARASLALALWLTLNVELGQYDNFKSWISVMQYAEWVPKGLAKIFFPDAIPQADVLNALTWVTRAAIVCMFFGLCAQTSAIVAALGSTLLVSVNWSPYPYWSHGSNVQLLAALSFMFGRSGDRWSIDAIIRHLRGTPDPVEKHNGRYWWPVLFAELSTHLFMFGAFYSKFTNGDGLWWAWSENMRNSIAVSWGMYRFDPPVLAEWITSAPVVYKTTGTLQLIAQAVTIFALFLVRRPVLRAVVGGGFFLAEIFGLQVVLGDAFWHPFWICLCVLSVNWEWFYRKLCEIKRDGAALPATPLEWAVLPFKILFVRDDLKTLPQPRATSKILFLFAALFFGYYIISIVGQLGERHLNYPFSSMAFYSENRDSEPFGVPKYYPIYRGFYEIGETMDPASQKYDFKAYPSDLGEPLRLLYATKSSMSFTTEDGTGSRVIIGNSRGGTKLKLTKLAMFTRIRRSLPSLRVHSQRSLLQYFILAGCPLKMH